VVTLETLVQRSRYESLLNRHHAWFLAYVTVGLLSACGHSSSPAGGNEAPGAAVAPQITAQPGNQTVSVGTSATYSVMATGSAPLAYQWNMNGSAVAGATGSSYTTAPTVSGDNGARVTVVVTDPAGSVTSSAATLSVTAGTDVVTYKYDVMRTGQNLAESTLTPANVNSSSFGKLNNLSVDGLVDAQPLYLSQLTVGGAPHNVLFVATEHDSVYAFDAETGAVLWQVSLLAGGEATSDNRGCTQVTPEIGITSTPVIDRHAGTHGTMFVVAMTKDSASSYHQRLHALDLATGEEMASSPTEIAATFGSSAFAPGQYKERAALLLNSGTIYTTWASHCDIGAYGGWIIALSETTLAITSVLNVAMDASGSGLASQGPSIWMSGGGPAADAAGNVYFLAANGRFDFTFDVAGFPSGGDYGNSFVKITSSNGTLAVSDYFTMSGELEESSNDVDLGSGGVMLLPDMADAGGTMRQLAVGAGKDGNLYVVDRNNMGKFTSVGNNIWQQLNGALGNGVWSTPAYFNSNIFYGPQGGSLRAFSLTNALLSSAPTSQTSTQFAYPGTFPVVSANGSDNAIVWAYENTTPAVLHAYAANNLATELYNSNQASSGRDQFGAGNKNIVPVVADGRVFVATTNSVAIFGLLP
jgi:hypothetical protein